MIKVDDDEECAYGDFYTLVRHLDGEELEDYTNDEENSHYEELQAILAKYPQFIDKYKKEDIKFRESIKDIK
ncbi:MAG: hypothetical protein AABW73_01935 [Nanoarchaeota archaeon]